jgi:DNA-binding NtrC family response regulator
MIQRAGPTDAPILILGPSGTGKELIARAIHLASDRKDRPFIAVNCSLLVGDLLLSELFGHVKGAFTGATGHRKGLLELAEGGTLFLDEAGDLPLATQAMLLRVVQFGEYRNLGGIQTHKANVRFLAATNRDLTVDVREGRFREDLFQRLQGVILRTRPLAETPEDIPLLIEHFLKVRAFKRSHLPAVTGVSEAAMKLLKEYQWPGNIRELEMTVIRALQLGRSSLIEVEDVVDYLTPSDEPREPETLNYKVCFEAFERKLFRKALAVAKGKIARAAELLGLHRTNLHRRLKQLDIEYQGE